jgi:hypothetical protein
MRPADLGVFFDVIGAEWKVISTRNFLHITHLSLHLARSHSEAAQFTLQTNLGLSDDKEPGVEEKDSSGDQSRRERHAP